ncbi:MAG: ribonuclease H-like domain-containing protein [Planctomycetota bacterium]
MSQIDHLSDLGNNEAVLYLRVAEIEQCWTAKGDPYLSLQLADVTRNLAAKIWHDRPYYEETAELQAGQVVKVLARLGSYQGKPQLEIQKLRATNDWDREDYSAEKVFGPGYGHVKDMVAQTLVMDIETAPSPRASDLPEKLEQDIQRTAKDRDWDKDKVIGLNPLFSQAISVAVGDAGREGGRVLFAPKEEELAKWAQDAPDWLVPLTEKELLGAFWTLAGLAGTVVTFNGRNFDLPFLRVRSAIHEVPVFVDLLSQPPYKHRPHLDLFQILTNNGRGMAPMNLDAACFAFGIESPKEAMDGSQVGPAYQEGRYLDIARYNLADVEATRRLYWKLKNNVVDFLV